MSPPSDHRDLIAFCDHARQRANWQPNRRLRPECRDLSAWFTTPLPPRHEQCPGCGCDCHAVTDADRELWIRLASEVDRYLKPSYWRTAVANLRDLDAEIDEPSLFDEEPVA